MTKNGMRLVETAERLFEIVEADASKQFDWPVQNPFITVLITAFNAAGTIKRALDSVWRQNYVPLEVVVVDDGSTDDTAAAVRAIDRDAIRLISLGKNRGVSAALNVGLNAARGEFIAFLDADDEWLDGKLQKQVAIIASQPSMSFVACGGHDVDLEGRITGFFGLEPLPYPPKEVWRAILARTITAKPCIVARRSMLLAVGGFDEALKIAEDQDMWIKLSLAGEVGFVPENLVRLSNMPNSLMKRYATQELEYCLPMLLRHLRQLGSRLTARERRHILRERYASIGRHIYLHGRYFRGAELVLRASFLGDRPIQNLQYLALTLPPALRLKHWARSKGILR